VERSPAANPAASPEGAASLVDLEAYRDRPQERERLASLLRLLPDAGTVLEIGTRDGHMSFALAERFARVTTLDLGKRVLLHPGIEAIAGDLRRLPFRDLSFEAVLCAEVLEHIPTADLQEACRELVRVCANVLVIGVPYRQDLRVGRTRCSSCRRFNPPWGHVNSFDEDRLDALFAGLSRIDTDRVGRSDEVTNGFSALLMNWAGNPWGTYEQEEACIHCGGKVGPPPASAFPSRVLSAIAERMNRIQRSRFSSARPCWIHCLYRKT